MKVLLIICAVVVLLQSFTLWKARSSDDKSSPTPEEVDDGKWELPTRVKDVEASLESFRLRIKLPWKERSIGPGMTELVEFRRGDKKGRLARFRLTAGTAVRIAYQNPQNGQLDLLCLCADGGLAGIEPQPYCGRKFKGCSTEGKIVFYGKEGQFTLEGLAGGTIEQF